MDGPTLTFQQQLSYRDFRELNAASWKTQVSRALLLLLPVVMLSMPLFVQPKPGTPPRSIWVVVPWAALFGLMGIFMLHIVAWLPWRQSADRVAPVQIAIDALHLRIGNEAGEAVYTWRDLTSITETRHLLLLWDAANAICLALSKSAMAEARVLDDVRALIAAAGLRPRRWTSLGG